MSNSITYSCQCLNIKLHLAKKYNHLNIEQHQSQNFVETPFVGWEFDLDDDGIEIVRKSCTKLCSTDAI